MQGHHEFQPELFSQIDYEALIPRQHLLRKIDRVLDLSFLSELTAPLYSKMGRPSIDPIVFVRMTLLSYLYNIDSDRRLCEEVGFNLAYRWFSRLSLKDPVPEHSSFTRIRDRLGEETYGKIFLAVLEQCRKAGLVKAESVMMDGSIIRANASIYNMEERNPEANQSLPNQDADTSHSKDGLSSNDMRRGDLRGKKIANETHVSKSDPESTLAGKAHEYKSFAYKAHHVIDADSRVIIDPHVTTGAVMEVGMICERIDILKENLNIDIGEAITDRGYGSLENLDGLEKRGIRTNIPLWSTRSGQGILKDIERGFEVDPVAKTVRCPAGHEMRRRGRDNKNNRVQFKMPKSICGECPLAGMCLGESKTGSKKVWVTDFFETLIKTHEKQKTPEFKHKLRERMWKMEGIFAEAKEHHGMRRARYRGRWKVQVQVYMTATVQNLKRLAAVVLCIFKSILSISAERWLGSQKLSKVCPA